MITCKIYFLFLVALSSVNSSKILVISPVQMRSHYIVVEELLRSLAESGHEITVVSQFKIKNPPPNYRELIIDIPKESYKDFINAVSRGRKNLNVLFTLLKWTADVTERTFMDWNFQALIHSNETFDLFLYEVFMNDALLGLAHHFKAPAIGYSTVGMSRWAHKYTGSPLPYSYMPHQLLGFPDEMNFLQRLVNTLSSSLEEIILGLYHYPKMSAIYQKYIPNPKPSFNEVQQSAVSLILSNHHFSFTGTQPLMTNVIEVGGMHIPRKLSPLPAVLQNFLDNATEGVVLFSLGSNLRASLMGDNRKAILKVLHEIKQKVVLNWDAGESLDSKKFFTAPWLPQNEILAHRNVKAFINHGGLLSTIEAAYHGVPMIGIATYADQQTNTVKTVERGYGVLLKYSNMSEGSFRWAVTEVLGNEEYLKAAQTVSMRFKDRPQTGLETAKYWVEYVIRHKGAKFLQSPAMKLNFVQYYNLDVVGFLVVVSSYVFKIVWNAWKLRRKVKVL